MGREWHQPTNASERNTSMSKKQTSPKVSTLASNVLTGKVKPTPAQTKTLAASVLSQDEKKGQTKKK